MSNDWTRLEVEAAVADHLAMLEAELRGEKYSKAQHRRNLSRLLKRRTDSAIERKHQNISAVLIELGLPYVDGYKPLRNFQQLLFDVVQERIGATRSLLTTVAAEVERSATVPTVDDILAALVDPPTPMGEADEYPRRSRERRVIRRGVDYLAMEAANRSLGAAGEEFVVRFEQARLLAARREQFAGRVEHIARTRGDGDGFDILSFEVNGAERFIEVKTTAYGQFVPFYVTRNELAASREYAMRYHLYRVFAFRKAPRLFWKAGVLDQAFSLDPAQFEARVG